MRPFEVQNGRKSGEIEAETDLNGIVYVPYVIYATTYLCKRYVKMVSA